MKTLVLLPFLLLIPFFINPAIGQSAEPSAIEIVKKADEKARGITAQSEMKMTIVRPTWKREMTLKSWAKGEDYALIVVTSPAREKGTAFLKRGNEIWNWQPSIERVVKLPPSMMAQSWMGSDFTNDDLVKESSIVHDFEHKMMGTETIDGRVCYKIQLTPKEDAAVVWGKIITWIDKKDFMQMKAQFYDEEGYLINTMIGRQVKMLGGKLLPSVLEITPAEDPGNKTIVEQIFIKFDEPIKDDFFSFQNMKRVNFAKSDSKKSTPANAVN